MQTTALLQKEAPKNTAATGGKVTANPLQKKQNPLQLVKSSQNPLQFKQPSNNPLQLRTGETTTPQNVNNTGLPDNLKKGVENLSGFSMDDVQVHYNSSKPTQLQALAYTQGTDIHVAPGQEKHLPHEAWHVVQQKQGRVQATLQKKGVAINDDTGLEREADKFGNDALSKKELMGCKSAYDKVSGTDGSNKDSKVVQRVIKTLLPTKFYRRSGGSVSGMINSQIEKYNKLPFYIGNASQMIEILYKIDESLNRVSSKKNRIVVAIEEEIQEELKIIIKNFNRPPFTVGKIGQMIASLYEIDELLSHIGIKENRVAATVKKGFQDELDIMEMVDEVMKHSSNKANLQSKNPRLNRFGIKDSEVFMRSKEVLHATNPLLLIDGQTLGDKIAASNEIKNIHQTGLSSFAKNDTSIPVEIGESPKSNAGKRLNAEVGLFYPQKYRRGSFSRTAYDKEESEHKGIDIVPPPAVLPKYGAVNLANSQFGAFEDKNAMPLHFAINEHVLNERTTFTSSDSLAEWVLKDPEFDAFNKSGMVVNKDSLPTDNEPWNMGPIATYDSNNFSQILGQANINPKDDRSKNPPGYIEAQIHGELRIDRDVSYVRANFAKLFGNPGFESLYNLLRSQKKKIIWYYYSDNYKEDTDQIVLDWGNADEIKEMDGAWKKAVKKRQEYLKIKGKELLERRPAKWRINFEKIRRAWKRSGSVQQGGYAAAGEESKRKLQEKIRKRPNLYQTIKKTGEIDINYERDIHKIWCSLQSPK